MTKRKRRSSLAERMSDLRLSDLVVSNLSEAEVKAIVREYTGDEPVSVQSVLDPKVPNCTAVRATFGKGRVLDLIIYHHTAGNDVDEVEFKHWPPRSV